MMGQQWRGEALERSSSAGSGGGDGIGRRALWIREF